MNLPSSFCLSSHVSIAIAAAFVIGCFIAALAHYVAPLRLLIDGRLTPFLNAFSAIGWLFLAMLWFGLDSFTVIFAVTMTLIPFTIINVRTGLQELDADLIELGRSLSRNPYESAFVSSCRCCCPICSHPCATASACPGKSC